MTSKFKLREPITGLDIERAQELCSLVIQGINQFQTALLHKPISKGLFHNIIFK